MQYNTIDYNMGQAKLDQNSLNQYKLDYNVEQIKLDYNSLNQYKLEANKIENNYINDLTLNHDDYQAIIKSLHNS
jgi:hypothetical protein